METYLIIAAIFSFIIGLCKVLNLGMLIRLWQHKKLHPNANLKDIESFEKNTKQVITVSLKPFSATQAKHQHQTKGF